MKKSDRPCLIAGNWKMYKTIEQALHFIETLAPTCETASCEVMLAVPFTALKAASDLASSTKIIIGAQNMNDATEGAFTGEIAAEMIKDAGAKFVLLGHSERRRLFSETNSFINRKVKRALASNLRPLLCIGETFEEREEGKTEAVLQNQLQECLEGVTKEAKDSLIVAYEPIWAIGTGKAATPELAREAHAFCRKMLEELWTKKAAQDIPLLYGGSVNPQNAEGYLEMDDIDGLLIGGASLQPDSFAKIIALRQNSAKPVVK